MKHWCECELLQTFWKIVWQYVGLAIILSIQQNCKYQYIRKEIQIKLFTTALFVVATKVEITQRFRKRKYSINSSSHILWIISHLWKTHESGLDSLTLKAVYTILLNRLKRKKKRRANCWVIYVIWSPHLFLKKKKKRTGSKM